MTFIDEYFQQRCLHFNCAGPHEWLVNISSVKAWWHQASSHYLDQCCWQSFMMPYGVTRPQWVNVVFLYRSIPLTDPTKPCHLAEGIAWWLCMLVNHCFLGAECGCQSTLYTSVIHGSNKNSTRLILLSLLRTELNFYLPKMINPLRA